jgi:putative salt-induced outer membrane protein YdiY
MSIWSFAYAQEQEEEKDPMKWNGDLALGISVARGNADVTTLSFSFSANKLLSEKFDWKNKGLFLAGKAGDVQNSQSVDLTSAAKWSHSARFFSRYEIHGIHDKFRNYRYRLIPNIAVGYKFLQSEATELSLWTGLSDTITKFYESGEMDSYVGALAGNDFVWKIASGAEFTQLSNLNLDLSDTSHILARIELSLAAAIASGWGLKISVIEKYDSAPETEGVKKNDFTFLTTISWKF